MLLKVTTHFLNLLAISKSQVVSQPCLKIEIMPAFGFEKREDSGLRKESVN